MVERQRDTTQSQTGREPPNSVSGEQPPPAESPPPRSQSTGTLSNNIPWKQALAFGLVAFVVGFAITAGFVFAEGLLEEATEVDTEETDETVDALTALGWVFYNTHFVDIEADVFLFSVSIDVLSEASDELTIPTPIWRLIPIGVLTATGYLLASRSLPAGLREAEYAKRGATIVVGYAPLVVVGTFLFTESTEGASLGPGLFDSLLIAGLFYPLFFGALGGYLAARLQS